MTVDVVTSITPRGVTKLETFRQGLAPEHLDAFQSMPISAQSQFFQRRTSAAVRVEAEEIDQRQANHKEKTDMELEGQTALITGGGTGIGAAIAHGLVAKGAQVCITGRRSQKLEEQAAGFPLGSVMALAGDVSDEEDVRRIVAATLEFGGNHIDILVNNAAYDVRGSITDLDVSDWRRILEVNLTGPFLLMKETLPYMVKNGKGSIINVSSIGGIRCMPGCPGYAATKAGLIPLTQQAALEYGPFGVRCNVICPGATRTEMLEGGISTKARGMGMDMDGLMARFCSHVPLRRASQPSEMVGICTFLASDASSFMTGAVLVIDGGANVVDVSGASIC
jgi:NAD(P)-dependent dehydrogenase (short-subunit alcohol dehydrogenase family)